MDESLHVFVECQAHPVLNRATDAGDFLLRGLRHFLAFSLVLAWIAVTAVTSPVYAILVRDSRRNTALYECPDR